VLNGRSEEALKNLHHVAKINGKPEKAEKITLEVSHQLFISVIIRKFPDMIHEVQEEKQAQVFGRAWRNLILRVMCAGEVDEVRQSPQVAEALMHA